MHTRSITMSGEAMSLFKRQNSTNWQMCFFVNGRKIRMSAKTSNKKVAQRIQDRIKGQIAEGKFLIRTRPEMPFDKLVDEFLEKHCKVEKSWYKKDLYLGNSLKRYFKTTPIGKITPYEIKEWRRWRSEKITNKGTKISKAALNRELAFLKTMFNLAVDWGWLVGNPTEKVKLLKGERKRMRFLINAEISHLILNANSYLKPIIITAISTGMRRGEILNLKWKDVDLEHGFIRLEETKNHEPRDLPISEYLAETLKGLKKIQRIGNYVFCKDNGEKRICIKESFKSACRKAGLEDFRFHDLRHTAASLLASGGCDIITLQNLLGHKTLAMTQRYAHLIPDKHKKTRAGVK